MSPATSNRPERPRDAEEAAPAPPVGGARARAAEVESSRIRPAPIDVAVCDKSPLILAGLEKLMEDDGRFRLVFKATDGEEFLDAARQPRFALAVIGWQLPTLHARDVLRALARQASAPKIVVYSGANDPAAPASSPSARRRSGCSTCWRRWRRATWCFPSSTSARCARIRWKI